MAFAIKIKKPILAASVIFAVLTLVACGGGSSSSATSTPAPTIKTGVFVDSAVEGLTYVSGDTTGKTDAAGTYKYEDGKTVTFKVGDVVLATVTPKATLTPVSLVSGAVDETHPTVTNIAKFLQTIDDDNSPSNGIKISAAADAAAKGKTFNFAQTIAAFDADLAVNNGFAAITAATAAGAHAAVTTVNAQSHLRTNLLAPFAGTYAGTFVGTYSGTFSVVIGSDGKITGSGQQGGVAFAIIGTVTSAGATDFNSSGGAGVSNFSGSRDATTGDLSGTWRILNIAGNGTFTGKKQ